MSGSVELCVSSKRELADLVVAKALNEGNSHDDVKSIYAEWAVSYDEHMLECNFSGAIMAARTVNENCPNKNMNILDVACGTGIVGEYLKQFGFTNVDGMDTSAEMLEKATSKNVYKNYICSAIGAEFSTDIPSNTYDAIVISGGFAPGHIPCEAVDEMIRIVKPGGSIFNVAGVRSFKMCGYKDKWEPYLAKKEEEKKWEEIRRTIFKNYNQGEDGILYIHKIL